MHTDDAWFLEVARHQLVFLVNKNCPTHINICVQFNICYCWHDIPSCTAVFSNTILLTASISNVFLRPVTFSFTSSNFCLVSTVSLSSLRIRNKAPSIKSIYFPCSERLMLWGMRRSDKEGMTVPLTVNSFKLSWVVLGMFTSVTWSVKNSTVLDCFRVTSLKSCLSISKFCMALLTHGSKLRYPKQLLFLGDRLATQRSADECSETWKPD